MILHSIETGNFKLDGGAMFGVVPKALWEKTNPADEKNRIGMSARSLLIEDGKRLILIDAGLGNKQNKKFFNHFCRWGDFSLDSSLKKAGFSCDDITDVFFTHLHFDHCGGAIKKNSNGLLVPSFKNALFWSNVDHWKWANFPNLREKASFLEENILPLQQSGQLNLLDSPISSGLTKTSLGFEVLFVDGHTDKQMLPVIKYKKETIVFAGDLIPTIGHLPIPYLMGYDTRPLLTLKEKKSFLDVAVEKNYLLFMEHDPSNELVSLKKTDRGVRLDKSHKLTSYF